MAGVCRHSWHLQEQDQGKGLKLPFFSFNLAKIKIKMKPTKIHPSQITSSFLKGLFPSGVYSQS